MKKNLAFVAVSGALLFPTLLFFPHISSAYKIDTLNVDQKNDFGLEPGKIEVTADPGQTVSEMIYVTDRIVGTTKFKVGVEDIKGTDDPNQPVVILDNERGPYSAKDFITPETTLFSLTLGQRIELPVTITIPKDATPGGYYSTVLVSNEPTVLGSSTAGEAGNGTKIVSRVGTLLFIKVNGAVKTEGALEDFRIKGPQKLFYQGGPFTFEILFHNTGNIHLIPYGTITIKNTLGKEVAELPVDAYFALPNSLRYRDIDWQQSLLFGRYTATVTLNRGYGDTVDTKTIILWVIPWKFIALLVAIVFVIAFLLFGFLRTFEIKKK